MVTQTFKVGDKVDILVDGKVFMPDKVVTSVGRKWLIVDCGVPWRFIGDGSAGCWGGPNTRFTLQHSRKIVRILHFRGATP